MTETCTLDDCDRPYYAKGLCEADYARAKRNGGNPRPDRSAWHQLTEVDVAKRIGNCSRCGTGVPVRVRQGKSNECGRKPRRKESWGKVHAPMAKADFTALREAQGNRCAICRGEGPLCADHCHETGRVRGMLCKNCNLGIGNLRDDLNIVRAAVAYLEWTP